jgi:hypothetical protein
MRRMEASGGRVDVGRVFGQTFETYQENFGPLVGGAAIIVGVPAILVSILAATGSLILVLVGLVIAVIARFLYVGYVVKLVQDVRDGRRDSSVSELFSAAMPYIGTLFLFSILAGLAIGFGLLLLIVPGLILITIWSVAAPSIVVENRGVFEAFGRSRELVRGEGWTVFAVILLALIGVWIISAVLGEIGAGIGDDAGRVILSTIAEILLAPIFALVSSILFFDLGGGGAAPTSAAEAPPTAPPPAA